jgi:hypothetical protein
MSRCSVSGCFLSKCQYTKLVDGKITICVADCCPKHKCVVAKCFQSVHDSLKVCVNHQNCSIQPFCKYSSGCREPIFMNSQYYYTHKCISCNRPVLKSNPNERNIITCHIHTCAYCRTVPYSTEFISHSRNCYCSQQCLTLGETRINPEYTSR